MPSPHPLSDSVEQLRKSAEKMTTKKANVTVPFIKTTLDAVIESGHVVSDITFIGSEVSGHRCTWEEFEEICKQQVYDLDSSYDVAYDLIVVFKDGLKMWRGDAVRGELVWCFQTPLMPPSESKQMTRLFTKCGDSMRGIHEDPTTEE